MCFSHLSSFLTIINHPTITFLLLKAGTFPFQCISRPQEIPQEDKLPIHWRHTLLLQEESHGRRLPLNSNQSKALKRLRIPEREVELVVTGTLLLPQQLPLCWHKLSLLYVKKLMVLNTTLFLTGQSCPQFHTFCSATFLKEGKKEM